MTWLSELRYVYLVLLALVASGLVFWGVTHDA